MRFTIGSPMVMTSDMMGVFWPTTSRTWATCAATPSAGIGNSRKTGTEASSCGSMVFQSITPSSSMVVASSSRVAAPFTFFRWNTVMAGSSWAKASPAFSPRQNQLPRSKV